MIQMKNEIFIQTQTKNHNMKTNNIIASTLRWCMLSIMMVFSCYSLSAQCEDITLACNGGINVSINENCFADITVDLILENPPFADFPDTHANYNVVVMDELSDTIVMSPTSGGTIGQEYIGRQLAVSIELVPCGISCWGYVTIEDKVGPQFSDCNNGFLPDVILSCEEFGSSAIPTPMLGSFCSDEIITFDDDTTAVACTGVYAIAILRTYTATDASGNSTMCDRNIFVEKADLKDIIFPDNYIDTLSSATSCDEADDLSPAVTGFPTGINCPNIMYLFNDIEYPQCGIQRKMLRDWFVIDWCTGESRTYGQIIKVVDNLAPRSVCPPDTVKIALDPASCLAYGVLNPMAIAGFEQIGAIDQSTLLDCSLPIAIEVGFLPAIAGTDQPVDAPYQIINANADGLYELPAVEQAAWIRYCFTDACGNSTKVDQTPDNDLDADNTCCFFEITTTDNNPPIAICEGFTKVPLLEGGETVVPASSFDDTSFDPCGEIARFEVKREQTSCPGYPTEDDGFGDSVHFCCADLGDTITIRLRVYDIDGNFSECLGLVCVQDQGSSSVACMSPSINLDCDEDFRDRTLTGTPTGGSDECNNGIRVGDDMFTFAGFDESCGIGTIVRTVRVTDLNGDLVKTCSQNIIFDEDDNPAILRDGDYTFPADFMADLCSATFSLDPSVTGLPTTTKEFGCTNIAISYKDSNPFTSNDDGICYKIQRTWTVVDWCRYDPSNPGQFSDTGVQEIVVKNQSVPTINCPATMVMVDADAGKCEAQVDITVDVSSSCNGALSSTYSIDLFDDGSVNDTGAGLAISGVYPVGTHKVTFRANNACGADAASCMVTFVVKGDKGPTPICLASIAQPLGDDGTIEVWASDFDFKSEGGCEGDDDLTFSFISPNEPGYPQTNMTFDCDDVVNGIATTIPIIIYIIDESGNFSSCFSEMILQDTKDICPDMAGSVAMIAGKVATESGDAMSNLMVEMINMTMQESNMQMTSSVGDFAFSELNYYMDYAIAPESADDYLNGVSTLDILHIQRHILGQQKLDSPYKMIAGDVDNSASITALDLIELRKLILGIYDVLPQNDSWVFVEKGQGFIDENNPWDYSSRIDLHSLYLSEMSADFVAVKVGDVNSTVNVNVQDNEEIESRKNNKIYISTDDVAYNAGELVAVPVRMDKGDDIAGIQFTLEFDADNLLFEGIDNGAIEVLESNFALLNNYDGVITFSVDHPAGISLSNNDILFTIYFESKLSGQLSEKVDINSNVTQAEAYTLDYDVLDLEFVTRDNGVAGNALEVFQNEPNPFSTLTNIAFYIPSKQSVNLTIYDANGKVVTTETRIFGQGINEFSVKSEDLDGSGILLYRIESESSSITKKMILVR